MIMLQPSLIVSATILTSAQVTPTTNSAALSPHPYTPTSSASSSK